nr:hypothetical protein EQLGYNXF_EQLGYNXF_CDS_0007 [Microvirus sp.]
MSPRVLARPLLVVRFLALSWKFSTVVDIVGNRSPLKGVGCLHCRQLNLTL